MLNTNYSEYNFEDTEEVDSIEFRYNEEYYKALKLLELGFYEEAYPILKKNILDNDNKESLFYLGYINEMYTSNIEEMLSYYIQYINKGNNEDNKDQVKEKLSIHYYMFNKKLKYLWSKNLLSICLADIGKDSLSLSTDDCFSNLDSQTLDYSEDSLKAKYFAVKACLLPSGYASTRCWPRWWPTSA